MGENKLNKHKIRSPLVRCITNLQGAAEIHQYSNQLKLQMNRSSLSKAGQRRNLKLTKLS